MISCRWDTRGDSHRRIMAKLQWVLGPYLFGTFPEHGWGGGGAAAECLPSPRQHVHGVCMNTAPLLFEVPTLSHWQPTQK